MRVMGRAVTCLAVVAGLFVPTPAGAATPVTFPEDPQGFELPEGITTTVDPASGWVPQIACDPTPLPGTIKLRDALWARYGYYPMGMGRACNEGTSEHADGRAIDWMVDSTVPEEREAAADFLAWATANNGRYARRLGIMYLIYNNHIWSVYRVADGWRSGSYGHEDHVHISLGWNGARGNVSWWTLQTHPTDYGPCRWFASQPAVPTATPRARACFTPSALIKSHGQTIRMLGMGGSGVTTAQRKLGVPQTGVVDDATRSALFSYQWSHDLPRTGVLDKPTWASLAPWSMTSDPYGSYTPGSAAVEGYLDYRLTSLKVGNTGRGPALLQIALGLPESIQTGYFGAKTRDAVKALQAKMGRTPTGVAGYSEWKYLYLKSQQ